MISVDDARIAAAMPLEYILETRGLIRFERGVNVLYSQCESKENSRCAPMCLLEISNRRPAVTVAFFFPDTAGREVFRQWTPRRIH